MPASYKYDNDSNLVSWKKHLMKPKAATATASGSGYGGSNSDKQKRNKGKKEAQKREQGTWAEWQTELKNFLKQTQRRGIGSSGATSNSNININETTTTIPILNILKQVLRCQAPNWWWKQPHRQVYTLALEVSMYLTRYQPRAWGDPDDSESAIAALEEIARTSKLLVSSLSSSSKSPPPPPSSSSSSEWLRQQLAKAPNKQRTKSTNDKDVLLPKCFLIVKDEAFAALRSVLEVQDCSVMGAHEHYRQIMKPLAFEIIDDSVISSSFEFPKHYYSTGGGYERTSEGRVYAKAATTSAAASKPNSNKKARKKTSSSNSGTMALWKELSTYPTALPIEYGSSIFVRALESELDKLRVLIIGPEDTPYANGCFFFDVAMGGDYPNQPPKVQFLTTASFVPNNNLTNSNSIYKINRKCYGNNAPVRFNPNLYKCGKVCLSLLGTWSGPSWIPKESTLLQVLVSLQSLVLGNPHPYFNEPGHEESEGTHQGDMASKQYSKNIRKMTLRVAMLPFLHNQLLAGSGCSNDEDEDRNNNKRRSTTPIAAVTASENKTNSRAWASTTGGKKRKAHGEVAPPPTTATAAARKKQSQQARKSNYWFPEFKEVLEQHFKLKKQSIRKQLLSWLQEDDSLRDLYTEFWEAFETIDERGRQKQKQKQQRASSVAPPVVFETTEDGVLLLDFDDDENLKQALANSMCTASKGKVVVSNNKKCSSSEVIELLVDSDDEAMTDRKPAAVVRSTSRSRKSLHCNGVVDLT